MTRKCPLQGGAVLGLALLGVLSSMNASAAVVYTTLGPSGQFQGSMWNLGTSNGNNQVVGATFSLSSSTTVGDAVLALGYQKGDNSPVNVYIESDNSGSPGAILYSLSQIGVIPAWDSGAGSGLVTFTCPSCNLAAGSYWLVAQQPDAGSLQGWAFAYSGSPYLQAPLASDQTGSATGPWFAFPTTNVGFEIETPTPEPASLILLGSGLLVLAGAIRRRAA